MKKPTEPRRATKRVSSPAARTRKEKETAMADDKPRNADFIGRVVSDAKNPPETRMLTGWFGDSGNEGYRRLYTDAELSSYVDIPDHAILYTEPLRDTQPSGAVMVWIKAGAALKQGGSAASRAARFLQGQVTSDYSASLEPEKAGFRCVTEVPCGEPTGFTGQCTKQPEVGGAWPCITAIPHCFEPTGFTGKCTHAPWPLPSQYIGCTFLHCPTQDLTHIPHICNVIATGQPGCVVVNPPQGDESQAAQKEGAAGEKALPATAIPGCGYTKSWGLCETHLLGCGYTQPPKCQVSAQIPCIPRTEVGCPTMVCPAAAPWPQTGINACTIGCGHEAAFAAAAQNAIVATAVAPCISGAVVCTGIHGCTVPPTSPELGCTHIAGCPTQPQTQCTHIGCPTQEGPKCPTACGPACQSQQPACTNVGPVCHPVCPTQSVGFECTQACPSIPALCPVTTPQIHCANQNVARAQLFAAQPQVAGGIHPTLWTQLGPQCPSHLLGCTYFGPQCRTYPRGDCTFFACPSPGIDCTLLVCTHLGPQCPHPSVQGQLCPITIGGPECPPASGFNCPSQVGCQSIACQSIACQPGGGGQEQAFAQYRAIQPQTLATVCTQFGVQCPTQPNGDCTFFGCPTHGQAAAAGPGGGCTHSGPQCPPTPATICTQFAPCPTHHLPCPSPHLECTMVCTHVGPGCPQDTIAARKQTYVYCTWFYCPTSIGLQCIP
jgi:hypothetical protein